MFLQLVRERHKNNKLLNPGCLGRFRTTVDSQFETSVTVAAASARSEEYAKWYASTPQPTYSSTYLSYHFVFFTFPHPPLSPSVIHTSESRLDHIMESFELPHTLCPILEFPLDTITSAHWDHSLWHRSRFTHWFKHSTAYTSTRSE